MRLRSVSFAGERAEATRAGAGGSLEWSYNPWREGPTRAAVSLAGAVTLVALAISAALPALALGVLAAAIFMLLAPGFVSTRCRVDAAGVARRLAFSAWDVRSWEAIRSASLTRSGLRIATRKAGGVLAPFHTIVLPLPCAPRDAGLRAALSSRLQDHDH